MNSAVATGDPCPQPAQLSTLVLGHMSNCTERKGYDYFRGSDRARGSEVDYAVTFFFVLASLFGMHM